MRNLAQDVYMRSYEASLINFLSTHVCSETKGLISCTDTAQLICAFVFMQKAGFLMTWLKSQYMYSYFSEKTANPALLIDLGKQC